MIVRTFTHADLIDRRDPSEIAARRQQIAAEMAAVAAAVPHSDALAVGGTVEHTAGPTWQQRVRIATVLIAGLPIAIGAAYLAARTITALAEWAGALLA